MNDQLRTLIERMKLAHVTFMEVSEPANISRSSLQKWSSGQRNPHPNNLAACERAFDEVLKRKIETMSKLFYGDTNG